MKCEFCEQEFSDTVYPIHIERCPKRKSVEPEQSPEASPNNVTEEIPASENPEKTEPIVEEEENQADKTGTEETDPAQGVEPEQSPEATAGKKKGKK